MNRRRRFNLRRYHPDTGEELPEMIFSVDKFSNRDRENRPPPRLVSLVSKEQDLREENAFLAWVRSVWG